MTPPLTREDVEALLGEVVDAAFQASSGSSVVFRTAERAEAALLAHDAALCAELDATRARLAEAEAAHKERAWALVAAVEAERDSLVPLARLGLDALEASRNGNDYDGGDIQEAATEYGAVVAVTMTAPCGEVCSCREEADFPVTCYHDTEATARARALLAPERQP